MYSSLMFFTFFVILFVSRLIVAMLCSFANKLATHYRGREIWRSWHGDQMKRGKKIRDSPMTFMEATSWSWPPNLASSLMDLAMATRFHALNLGSKCGKHGGEVGDVRRVWQRGRQHTTIMNRRLVPQCHTAVSRLDSSRTALSRLTNTSSLEA